MKQAGNIKGKHPGCIVLYYSHRCGMVKQYSPDRFEMRARAARKVHYYPKYPTVGAQWHSFYKHNRS